MPKKKIKVKTSFQTITEESSKEGDYEDYGWEDEQGETFDTIQEVADFLKDKGVVEASSCCFSPNLWYITEGEMDMHTGETKILNFHIENATPSQQKQIFMKLFPQSCEVKRQKR